MTTNSRVRFLPIVMIPAILPAVVMPAMRNYVPANMLAAAMGVSIGLAIVGLAWMIRGGCGCSDDI
ncbi:hypothetical protein [Sphingomonas psychrolutea]|uniref:Uncharacterized protein n=1 Tax=Sphingomonas psychrolutea TaxID=1259676 RepID=A0ABQ1G6W3_9SPHN|nr:hypothetical protein [Sphingomonas psychrolutea]GGA37940.1 hypothetical protein GCM10011395_05320 [Sphingomonas psychrolutea]